LRHRRDGAEIPPGRAFIREGHLGRDEYDLVLQAMAVAALV
jgi:hypothetical protein